MEEPQKVELQIRGVEVLDFMIKTPKIRVLESNTFQFEIKIEHTFQEDKDTLFVRCMVKIYDKPKETLYSELRTSCAYMVKELSRFKNIENNKIQLPSNLLNMLNTTSVATTRGMLHCQLRGTFLHNATMPMVEAAKQH